MLKKTCNAADIENDTIEEQLPTKKRKQKSKGKGQNKKARAELGALTPSSKNSAAPSVHAPVPNDSITAATPEVSKFQ